MVSQTERMKEKGSQSIKYTNSMLAIIAANTY